MDYRLYILAGAFLAFVASLIYLAVALARARHAKRMGYGPLPEMMEPFEVTVEVRPGSKSRKGADRKSRKAEGRGTAREAVVQPGVEAGSPLTDEDAKLRQVVAALDEDRPSAAPSAAGLPILGPAQGAGAPLSPFAHPTPAPIPPAMPSAALEPAPGLHPPAPATVSAVAESAEPTAETAPMPVKTLEQLASDLAALGLAVSPGSPSTAVVEAPATMPSETPEQEPVPVPVVEPVVVEQAPPPAEPVAAAAVAFEPADATPPEPPAAPVVAQPVAVPSAPRPPAPPVVVTTVSVDEAATTVAPAAAGVRAEVAAKERKEPVRVRVAGAEATPLPVEASSEPVRVAAEREGASYEPVAPVEMWFGEARIGVKAGTKTFAEFQRLAGVLFDDLKGARVGS